MDKDQEHLNILAIVYYVLGWINVALGVLIGLFLGVFGLFAVFAGIAQGDEEALLAGVIVFVFMLFCLFVLGGIGALVIYTGHCLKHHKHYILCFVMAAFMCTNVPLGTVLGVFTIIVLVRPTVKMVFERGY